MATAIVHQTDTMLQRYVQDELNWEPSINAAEISVTVTDGIVRLTGFVDTYFQKRPA
jgi:osmotically-inducible protein OsmY